MRRSVLVVALVLLLAAGGSATAASLVDSGDIKDNTIKSADIKDGTIKEKDLDEESVYNRDIKEKAITMSRLAETTQELINAKGAPGPAGPKGDTGAAGPKGADGVVNAYFDSDAEATEVAAVQSNFGDTTGGSLIRNLTLPAGSYNVTATTTVRGADDGPKDGELNTRVRCNLVADGKNLDTFYQDFFRPDEESPGYREAFQVGALVTFGAQTTVELRCYSFRPGGGTDEGEVPSSKLIATLVTSVTAGH
jgi:hypothetical protein